MSIYSHSKLDTFESCPLQYKYTYIDKVKVESEDTVETFLGSRVHEALEKLYNDIRYEKLLTLEELISYYNEIWKENWIDTVKIAKDDYSEENYRKMGERYIKDYYKKHTPFDEGIILGLETSDFINIDEEGKYKYSIRIDRLMNTDNGQYEVHDYKTSMKLPTQEELDQDRQLAMYSLWVRKHFKDFKKVKLVWHYMAFNKDFESYRTKEQLENLRKEVLAEIKEMEETENFLPRESYKCRWCFYQHFCPLWKHEKELEEKPENEYLNDDGVKLVDEYVNIKEDLDDHKKDAGEKLEKIKEALIEFCKKNKYSVVYGSEKKISIKEEERLKFSSKNTKEREELIEIMNQIGKLDEVVDIDTYKLAKIITYKEWDLKELEELKKFWKKEKSYRLFVSKKE
jgi:putative RecB family exonuclease